MKMVFHFFLSDMQPVTQQVSEKAMIAVPLAGEV